MSGKKPPLFPSFTDGYAAPVTSLPGVINPTFPSPAVGPPPSGAAQPVSPLKTIVSSVPPTSSSLPTAASGPGTTSAQQARHITAAAPPTYAEEVGQRAWALLDPNRWTLASWFSEATSLLDELRTEVAPGGKADPATCGSDAWLALQPTLEHMLALGDASHTHAWVERVCVAWWDTLTEIQTNRGLAIDKCYRAMAAYILARLKLGLGDRGSALRWAALAHAADRLAMHPGGGGAEVVLKFGLGVPASVVDELDKQASEQLAAAGGDWKTPAAFPEMILTRTLALPGGSALVAPILSSSAHSCRPFLANLLQWINAKAITSDEKGSRLEWMVAYLTGTLPGVWAQRGFNAMGFACEEDVVGVQVGTNTYGLPGDARAILIECKNWESEVRSSQTGYFLARMKYVGARLGVLVAKTGITGTKDIDAKNALRFLQGFCLREGVVCLVVTGEALHELAKRGTFAELLDAQYRSMTYGDLAKA